jgi:glycosyltransferase involved in cell wall biosynthesis
VRAGASGADPVDVAVLSSWDFAGWRAEHGVGQLPFRMDHLEHLGFRLSWSDAIHRPGWASSPRLRRLERATVPFTQAALMAATIARSEVVLAMFESEASAVVLARRLMGGRPRARLVVVSCWLAEILTHATPRRRAAYRWAYRCVDRLVYFSANQGPVLAEHLGLGADRLRHVPFGVDDETFRPPAVEDGGYVLVVGRDRGRDWPTTFAAVEGLELPVKLCCRPSDLAGRAPPANVELLGYVDRQRYRELLGRARVVVVATRAVAYPSGQSVLLEAMAMGRAVVATATPALGEYLRDGETALTVAPGAPAALRRRILDAYDPSVAAVIGRRARREVEGRFGAASMWAAVGAAMRD